MMPERVMQANGQPGDKEHPDWDGYYRIYYFQAPKKWFENPELKESGFEIGCYSFSGIEQVAKWPGIPAKKLAGTSNIYYACIPSYMNFIIWNNGIDAGIRTAPDYDPVRAQFSYQTTDINVRDGMFNQLGLDDLCGSLSIPDGTTTKLENPYTKEVQVLYNTSQAFFDPKTKESTTTSYMVNGTPVLDENGFPMNPFYDMDYTYLPGDVNTDGRCLLEDVLLVQKHLALAVTLTPDQIIAADVDQNGTVSIYDALLIQKIIAKVCV